MALEFINNGTATVDAGGTVVTGDSTSWALQVSPGDFFGGHVGRQVRIASVDSNTQVTLAYPWPGEAQNAGAYEIQVVADGSRYQETTRQLFNLLSTNAFFEPDASGTLANRDAYDAEKQGFSYLDLDEGEVYYKASDTSGDWAGPFTYAKGDKGDKGNKGDKGDAGDAATVSVGSTETVAYDADAAVSNSGTAAAAVLDFALPRGAHGWAIEPELVDDGDRRVIRVADFIGGEGAKPAGVGLYVGAAGLVSDVADAISIRGSTGPQGGRGVTWRGAWDIATDYVGNDVVVADDANGDPAAWIALTATTGDDPQSSTTEWALFPGSFPASLDYGLLTGSIDTSRDYGALA